MLNKNTNYKYYLSIVIPLYNEEENLKLLWENIVAVLAELKKTFEIIFIDDGSTDKSFAVLKELKEKNENIKIIKFKKNFGQTAAIQAGFDYAQGEIIITMDADLQNDPQDIPKFLKEIEEGYDVVSGWRRNRKDPFFSRKIPSYFANFLISFLTGIKLHDYGCTLKAYKKEVVENLSLHGEMHRFIPALCSMDGAKISEIEVEHHPRKYGISKYGLKRTIRVILDLITVKFFQSFLTSPMQVFGFLGILLFFVGIIFGFYLLVATFILKHTFIYARGYLILDVLFILMGIQFITLGLLGEVIIRTYYQSQKEHIYKIKEII